MNTYTVHTEYRLGKLNHKYGWYKSVTYILHDLWCIYMYRSEVKLYGRNNYDSEVISSQSGEMKNRFQYESKIYAMIYDYAWTCDRTCFWTMMVTSGYVMYAQIERSR